MSAYIPQSKSNDWATPQDLFDKLHKRYKFTVDVCASKKNAKVARYYDEKTDGLAQDWTGERVWCNPPYGRVIRDWVKKAADSAAADPDTLVVVLVPARTDTKWFHESCIDNPNCTIEFIRGRLKFGDATTPAPFPSLLLVFQQPDESDE